VCPLRDVGPNTTWTSRLRRRSAAGTAGTATLATRMRAQSPWGALTCGQGGCRGRLCPLPGWRSERQRHARWATSPAKTNEHGLDGPPRARANSDDGSTAHQPPSPGRRAHPGSDRSLQVLGVRTQRRGTRPSAGRGRRRDVARPALRGLAREGQAPLRQMWGPDLNFGPSAPSSDRTFSVGFKFLTLPLLSSNHRHGLRMDFL
jgi:hypothetical protein